MPTLPVTAASAWWNNALLAGKELPIGANITSVSGQYALTLQSDGNLCILNTKTPTNVPIWCNGENGHVYPVPEWIVIYNDGELVSNGRAGTSVQKLWTTHTAGQGDATSRLFVTNRGNAELWTADPETWGSYDYATNSFTSGTKLLWQSNSTQPV